MKQNDRPDRGLRLEVLIATFGAAGLRRVATMTLPRVDGVAYVVACQNPEGRGEALPLPEALAGRGDVRVAFTASRGLSVNRNDLLDMAAAPLVLIADDDLHYTESGLRAVVEAFDSHPDVDIAAFRYEGATGKVYPDAETDLGRRVKGYYVGSIEIAMRLQAVRRAGVRFNPLLGIGAPYAGCGEEVRFVDDALRAGLRGRFFPVTIVSHPHESTGLRPSLAMYRGKGVTIYSHYRLTWPLRIVLEGWRARSVRAALAMAGGAFYAMRL